jgi:transposase InsO family protein
MKKLTHKVSIADVTSCPESVWIVDVAILCSAGEQLHCALVQDLKTRRVLGWATALDADPTLVRRAVELACTRYIRTRPATLYLDSASENFTPHVIAALACQEFQLRFIGGHEQFLLKPLELVWKDLQGRFTAAGAPPDNDDWFD